MRRWWRGRGGGVGVGVGEGSEVCEPVRCGSERNATQRNVGGRARWK